MASIVTLPLRINVIKNVGNWATVYPTKRPTYPPRSEKIKLKDYIGK